MRRKNRCYISGPITGVENYLEIFDKWEFDVVQTTGWTVINPARVNYEMPSNTEYEEYMDMCETMLGMCDRIFLIPGWMRSKGCVFERHYAKIHGLKIFVLVGDKIQEVKDEG